ncbi:uncharacterized protein ATNIH1004_004401 [Aspergillus tanneri]|uniref:HIT-type domain-containing protein n=1 Tax=Aspergillus tanneri TaxID=1220188 RepID=A0A5M9MRH3_9EURO|nr:uncharacterized protein ATNIH1004_004401 [Aspergillus tanneri]KAA8648516.1 hypothetical protein ATNIH1004_004401 [Aspergillus tanneri]
MSCSLACTQSHKIYCAPKAASPNSTNEADNRQLPHDEANGLINGEGINEAREALDPKSLASSPELKTLFEQCPSLRDELRDIYKTTLEEEWVEVQSHGGRTRSFHRGRGGTRNRGPWTREKGFNRGLGKVRKYRERCDEGLETGRTAEGFVRFLTLVNGEKSPQESG